MPTTILGSDQIGYGAGGLATCRRFFGDSGQTLVEKSGGRLAVRISDRLPDRGGRPAAGRVAGRFRGRAEIEYDADEDEDELTEAWQRRDFEPGPTVFAESAVDGGLDGTTRRPKGVVAEGKLLTEKNR